MNRVKVSVIVPIYNVDKWLPRCADSLINQTLEEIEIIFINDGSPDNSGKIIDEYAKKDARVKVIHQENGGVAVARNAGLKIATGEYLGFCDPDDYVDTDFYEKLYARAQQTQSDIVKGQASRYDIKGNHFLGPKNNDIKENRGRFSYSFWSAIYKSSFIKDNKINFPVGVITGQDVVFLTKAVVLADKIELVDDTKYNYEKRENSLDSEYLSDKKVISKTRAIKLIIDFINSVEVEKSVYNLIFQSWLNYLMSIFYRNDTLSMKMRVIESCIQIYGTCKYREDYDRKNPEVARFMAKKNKLGMLNFLMNKESYTRTSYWKLFTFIPLVKIMNNRYKIGVYLFNFILLLIIRKKADKSIFRLFGILPVFTRISKWEDI